MAITFDTLKFVDDLEAAQVPREQARAIVQMVRDSHDAADVATKGDIELLRKDIALARRDTIIWLGGMLVAGFGLVLRYVT